MSNDVKPLTAEMAENAYGDASYARGAFTQMALRAIADGRHTVIDTAELERLRKDAEIGARWLADSSLETWFPFTAEELERLRADARRYRWLRMMCDSECSIGGFENPGTAIAGVVGLDFNGSRSFQRCDGEQLDAAIDARARSRPMTDELRKETERLLSQDVEGIAEPNRLIHERDKHILALQSELDRLRQNLAERDQRTPEPKGEVYQDDHGAMCVEFYDDDSVLPGDTVYTSPPAPRSAVPDEPTKEMIEAGRVASLLETLKETRTDLVVLRGSVADAEKRDPKWEGMTAKVQEWIDRTDAAISAQQEQNNDR